MPLASFTAVLIREKQKHGQGLAWAILLAVTLGYMLAPVMCHPQPGISIRFRQRPSPAGTRDGGLQESPLNSPDIPHEAYVDVSE